MYSPKLAETSWRDARRSWVGCVAVTGSVPLPERLGDLGQSLDLLQGETVAGLQPDLVREQGVLSSPLAVYLRHLGKCEHASGVAVLVAFDVAGGDIELHRLVLSDFAAQAGISRARV